MSIKRDATLQYRNVDRKPAAALYALERADSETLASRVSDAVVPVEVLLAGLIATLIACFHLQT